MGNPSLQQYHVTVQLQQQWPIMGSQIRNMVVGPGGWVAVKVFQIQLLDVECKRHLNESEDKEINLSIYQSSAKSLQLHLTSLNNNAMTCMNMTRSNRPITLPCTIPLHRLAMMESKLPTLVCCNHPSRKVSIHPSS
jgi:hypothetical protein